MTTGTNLICEELTALSKTVDVLATKAAHQAEDITTSAQLFQLAEQLRTAAHHTQSGTIPASDTWPLLDLARIVVVTTRHTEWNTK